MWIIFLLKQGRGKMRKRGTFGVLLHSKHFKMFSKSRRQLDSYTPGVNDQLFSTELSRTSHCVCGFLSPWGRERKLALGLPALGKKTEFSRPMLSNKNQWQVKN